MANEPETPPFPFAPLNTAPLRALNLAPGAGQYTITGIPAVLQVHPSMPSLTTTSLIIPAGNTSSGILVGSTQALWRSIANTLRGDWSIAYQIPPDRWEEIVAGAFKNDGYDEVILTPRSGDHGRDVIAIKHGVGCIKILGSVKAYAPGHNVSYDAVRALMGVIASERDTSKGIITTTSNFPPLIESDPLIAPLLPTRLELINGEKLQKWLGDLSAGS